MAINLAPHAYNEFSRVAAAGAPRRLLSLSIALSLSLSADEDDGDDDGTRVDRLIREASTKRRHAAVSAGHEPRR